MTSIVRRRIDRGESGMFAADTCCHACSDRRNPVETIEITPGELARAVLAQRPDTPADELVELAWDESFAVREAVVHNTAAPEAAIRVLATDPASDLRFYVANRESCPEDILRALARDSSSDVRIGAADNPAVSDDVLEALCSDMDENVRAVAREARDRRTK